MKKTEAKKTVFKTPFSLSYWKAAAGEVHDLRVLTLTALFIALNVVIGAFFIPVGESLRIYFTFFTKAISCCICGPVLGLFAGFVSDILGFILNPNGGFFFGYTLSSMAGYFFYAIFLYRTRITVLKLFLCKLCINLFVNLLMGSLWSAILYGKGYYYYFAKSLVKNGLLLPVEVVLLVLVFNLVRPLLTRLKLIPDQPGKAIPLI